MLWPGGGKKEESKRERDRHTLGEEGKELGVDKVKG